MICIGDGDYNKSVKKSVVNSITHEEMRIDIIQQEVNKINDTIQNFKYELNKIYVLELADEKNKKKSEILSDKVRVLL